MKTYKHLYPQVIAFDNLLSAFYKARKGKRLRPDVSAFEYRLESNLWQLQQALAEQSYLPGAYRHFTIHDPKTRLISAAPFPDRVVHHALCNVIEPIFEKRFITDSYACRKNKGTHRAVQRFVQFMPHNRYVLKADIKQYFPSIDHEVLLDLLANKIADPQVMNLLSKILASGRGVLRDVYDMQYFPGDDLFAVNRPRGLPIGNLTSQFLSNVYLHALDNFVKQELRVKAYIRYCDDFVLMHKDKSYLQETKQAIETFLINLRLSLHPKKTRVFPLAVGTDFLGYRIYPEYIRLRKENIKRFVHRFHRQRRLYAMKQIDLHTVTQSVNAWIGHVAHANTYRLREQLFQQLPLTPIY